MLVYQLTRESMRLALDELAGRDDLLKNLLDCYGTPPLWRRTQSFATLVHIVIEQKISLDSARAVMQRVCKLCPGMQPREFLMIKVLPLREAGLSERKISYCYSIAEALLSRQLNLPLLRKLNDDDVVDALTAIRGIGPWTAGVYLMMALCRADAWASGDRALLVSYSESAGIEMPEYAQLDCIAESWRPYRAAAARMLWYAYLQRRNRSA
jgi:DNA-3-methyladenine glycosylase II